MKVEFIEKSGADHAFDSTLIGFNNGWILSIGADNPIIERIGDTVNWVVNKQMNINDIAFVDFGNFVFFDRRNDSYVGTTFGAVVHAKDYCKSNYHHDFCDTCGQHLFDVGSGLQRNSQCQLCWESECADSFWRQQHDDNFWEKDSD